MKHLLSMQDLSPKEIDEILKKSEEFKKLKNKTGRELLEGKTLAMIFEKPSTRTRISFEVAMAQLGGRAIYLNWNDLQLGRGETIADTSKVLSRYVDAIAARLFKHEDILELARHSGVPVVNALTSLEHPCQTLADLMTIREHKGRLQGLKLAWVGDGNNVCNSLMLGCSLVGMDIAVACPKGYEPKTQIVDQARKNAIGSRSKVEVLHDPNKAVVDADVVYTDVFVSMGMEKEMEKRSKAFRGYQINSKLLKLAKKDVVFMHCLPAHRGEEVTGEVIDGPRSIVFDQAENRLHAQKAVLVHLLSHL